LRSANASWGYLWTSGNKSFLVKVPNIEYNDLTSTDSLNKLLASIPQLKLAFKSGLVVGSQFVYNSVKKRGIATDFFRFNGEQSGFLLGFIRSLDEGPLWRYVKGDIEIRRHIDYKNSELALRAFAGAGWSYGREGNGYEQTLPFYKAYFAGGPNSMRGWQVRQLGLGSSHLYDTLNADRFGDVQLEANVEYRFLIGTLYSIKINSALYVDAGNIWNRHLLDPAGKDAGSDFRFNRFYNEIAFDAGTGLRLDFDFFVLRLDYAYKIRDPQRAQNADKWFYGMNIFNGQFQVGIGYPF
jgi:outer membrane protein insertion porin family